MTTVMRAELLSHALFSPFSSSSWQVLGVWSRSLTPHCGGRSYRTPGHCLSTVATPPHQVPALPSPPTCGIRSGRGRCYQRPQTAPSTSGTGSTNQLAAADRKGDFMEAGAGRSAAQSENLHTVTTLLPGSHMGQQELGTAANQSSAQQPEEWCQLIGQQ